jgi:predicted Zn-dependent peptidase
MPDKGNIDVRMGHPLPVRRNDDDYLPLYIANYILGGNFSARLMATIRDEMGLTYGINSSLSGISTRYNGHWQVGITLSQENLARGLDATRAEVQRFVDKGATEDELAAKKTTVTGSYTVGLATTKRLAQSILTNAERGFDVDYLDRFPSLIESLTLDEVNSAVQRHVDPARFHTAMAGTVPQEAPQGA